MSQKYHAYKGQMANKNRIPNHVAIIMDGNGRWALQQGFSRTKGHRKGVESAWNAVTYCLKHRISTLTLFAFGQENWKRPTQEVRNLFRIFYLLLKRDSGKLRENNIKLRIVGDRKPFSDYLKRAIEEIELATTNNTALTLNIAINYSGRWDVLQAIENLALQSYQVEYSELPKLEKQFERYLCFFGLPEPDLFIRTSGVQRLSNFLLWDLAYTELYFSDVLWPNFTNVEFDKAIHFFNQTERRFGLISEQVEAQCSHIES